MAAEGCKLLCETLWSKKSSDYWACQDVAECFLKDMRSGDVVRTLEEIDATTRDTLTAGCAFGKRGPGLRASFHRKAVTSVLRSGELHVVRTLTLP